MITTEERGWAGHFIGSAQCHFKRNTLVTDSKRGIVISTIGGYHPRGDDWVEIGLNRYYETMMFLSDMEPPYMDALIEQQIFPDEGIRWEIDRKGQDKKANEMHDNFVKHVVDNFERYA